MRFLSHVHIHDGDPEANARVAACTAQARGYTHLALGCHNWPAPAHLMAMVREEYGVVPVRYSEVDTSLDYPNKRRPTVQIAVYNLRGYSYFKPFMPFDEAAMVAHQLGGKVVLVHPESQVVLDLVAVHLDGCEVFNGIEKVRYEFLDRYLLTHPGPTPFLGADWHTWGLDVGPDGGKGDPSLFTELPDDWFGEIVP